MKKLIVAAAALAVAVMGFGSLGIRTASADVSKIWVVNDNVVTALNGNTAVTWTAPTAANLSSASLDAWQAASAGQVNSDTANAGATFIVIQTDGTTSGITVNGRGLTCDQVFPAVAAGTGCDGTTSQAPASVTGAGVFLIVKVATNGSFVSGNTVTAIQGPTNVAVNSNALTLVTQAHDLALTASKTTVQAGATACAITQSTSSPTTGAATVVYTDINGNALVGYKPTFATSSASKMAIGNATGLTTTSQQLTTMLQADGTTIGAVDAYCGIAAGTATLSGSSGAGEIAGVATAVTRTAAITITGVPASVALAASPAAIPCDGTSTSTVTATVTDAAGNDVVDGTPVTFSVVALGTANPINATTTGGTASSVITPLSGSTSGVVVTVSSGSASAQVRIDCQAVLLTPTAGPGAATATPTGGVTPPGTGNGGYLGQNSGSGFPMWALAALVLGSFVLVAGGAVVRRAGK